MKYIKGIIIALIITSAFSLLEVNAVVVGYNNIKIPALGRDYITGEERKETNMEQSLYTERATDSVGGNNRGVKARTYGMYSSIGYSEWVTLTIGNEDILTSDDNSNRELGSYKLNLRATTTNSLTQINYWGVWSVF